jgi:hypothetical protein
MMAIRFEVPIIPHVLDMKFEKWFLIIVAFPFSIYYIMVPPSKPINGDA